MAKVGNRGADSGAVLRLPAAALKKHHRIPSQPAGYDCRADSSRAVINLFLLRCMDPGGRVEGTIP